MSVQRVIFEDLKHSIDRIGRKGHIILPAKQHARISTGHAIVDSALGGGLMRGALHDILPVNPQDGAAASGFALGLVALFSCQKTNWVWVRQGMAGKETGEPYGPGLAAFGLDPNRLILVMTGDIREALRATEESVRCSALSSVLFEPWGDPKALDLTATRRLILAAEASNVALITLRSGGHVALGSARTRWAISAASSNPEQGATGTNAGIGNPIFKVALTLNRQAGAGEPDGPWIMEWNHAKRIFKPAALSVARPTEAINRSVTSPRTASTSLSGTLRNTG